MNTLNSHHGPVAILSKEEWDQVDDTITLLENARKIESDNGKLHVRNYSDLAAAEAALLSFKYQRYLSMTDIDLRNLLVTAHD